MTGIVQAFVGHSAGQSPVAYHYHYFPVILQHPFPLESTDASRDRGGGMSGFQQIVCTFGSFRKAGETALFPDCRKTVISTGQQFMGVTLMAHIPEKHIFWRFKDAVQSDG